jgi:hypothetical protein
MAKYIMTTVYIRDGLLPPLGRFILFKCPFSAEFIKHFLENWLVCSLPQIQVYYEQNYLYCQDCHILDKRKSPSIQMPTYQLENLSIMKKCWAFWLTNEMGFQRIKYFEAPYCLK